MPKTKQIKRNLYTTLKKFAVWLNKVEHEPTIVGAFGKKIIKFNRKIEPTENISVYIKQISGELSMFVQALTTNLHHEKLAKETKKKLETFDRHLVESWHHIEELPRGSINALNTLQKKVQSSQKKVNSFLKKIQTAKKRGSILQIKPLVHLANEKTLKKKQAPNKTYRTHLNVLKIATKKRPGS